MISALTVLALTVTGSMFGVELCVALFLNRIFEEIPDNAGLVGRSEGARLLGAVMPFWYAASIVTTLMVAVLLHGESASWTGYAAAALFVVSIVMSVTLLVPINNRAKTWTPATAPIDWREQLRRWDVLHHIRLAVIASGFVLLAIGAVR